MYRRYFALRSMRLAQIAVVPLATSACGFAFTSGPPPSHQQMARFTCTESDAGPILDVVTAGLQGVVAVLADDTRGATMSLGYGALYAASAYTGFKKTSDCRDAQRLAAQRRMLPQEPPSHEPEERPTGERPVQAQEPPPLEPEVRPFVEHPTRVQELPIVQPGEPVRIWHGWRMLGRRQVRDSHRAVFTELTSDSLVVQLIEPWERLALPLDSVARLEVYQDRRANTAQGAAAGGVAGFFVGLVVGMDKKAECEEQGKWMCGVEGGGWATAGLMGGAAVGALVGSLIKTDRWEEVPLDRLRVYIAPHPNGFAAGLTVRF